MMHNDESTESWDEYRRTMSHEMRTPVNHILSYAELVREDAEERGLHGLATEMSTIEGAGQAALKLVGAFLETRPPSGATGLDATQAEIAALMRDVTRHIARIRDSHEVQAAADGGADLARDLDRIEAAAQRLLALVAQ